MSVLADGKSVLRPQRLDHLGRDRRSHRRRASRCQRAGEFREEFLKPPGAYMYNTRAG